MKRPDRRQGTDLRQVPRLERRPDAQHLIALVRVPPTASAKVGEPEEGCGGEDGQEAQQFGSSYTEPAHEAVTACVSGLPATRSPRRAMLTASKPASIPGVSR